MVISVAFLQYVGILLNSTCRYSIIITVYKGTDINKNAENKVTDVMNFCIYYDKETTLKLIIKVTHFQYKYFYNLLQLKKISNIYSLILYD